MDNLLQQFLTLIDKGSVEQRCAGLLIVAALKLDNAAVVKSAGTLWGNPNPVLKDYALRYFEEVRPKNQVPWLVKFLDDPEKGIQERAVRCLSQAGPAAVQPLLERASEMARGWQLNAARVLCAVGGAAAIKGLLQMLATGNDELNKAVCDLMTPAIREMNAQEQELLFAQVEAFGAGLDLKQQRPAVISALRLLGQLGRPQSRRWLCKFVGAEHPPGLRSHALVGLLRCLREQDLRKDEYAKIFPLLEEAEFSEVTRLALDLLDAHDLPEDSRARLSKLFESPHADVQKFALRRMGEVGSPATVRTLLEQLGDADYRRREVAARSLRKIPEARNALVKELLGCENASKAWSIAELLPSFDGKWRKDNLEALWKRLQGAISAEDRIQTAFLHTLKQADAEYAYQQLAAQGARLIKAKKYKEAIGFLAPLREFSSAKPDSKFQLAVAQLKLHSHTVATHRQHPAVELLSELYRNTAFPLFETLKKEKSLAPEDIFSLGFSLVERDGAERSLGTELLELLASRFPRNKVGRSAKNKLKLVAG